MKTKRKKRPNGQEDPVPSVFSGPALPFQRAVHTGRPAASDEKPLIQLSSSCIILGLVRLLQPTSCSSSSSSLSSSPPPLNPKTTCPQKVQERSKRLPNTQQSETALQHHHHLLFSPRNHQTLLRQLSGSQRIPGCVFFAFLDCLLLLLLSSSISSSTSSSASSSSSSVGEEEE